MVLSAISITMMLYYIIFVLAEEDLCSLWDTEMMLMTEVPIQTLSCSDFSRNIRYDSIPNIK